MSVDTETNDPELASVATQNGEVVGDSSAAARPRGLFDDLPGEQEPVEGDYRALSTAAVSSLVLGLLAISAILGWTLLAIPLLGLCLGIYGVRTVNRYPQEYTGKRFGQIGIALSAIFLVAGVTWQSYVYATEVPEGYTRINYELLQPNPEILTERIPPAAPELDGELIFIKGYVYPTEEQTGIRKFMLARDQGDCCFGGNPKETERILVTLKDPRGFRYSPKQFKVAGKFRFQQVHAPAGMAGGDVFYHLDDAELR